MATAETLLTLCLPGAVQRTALLAKSRESLSLWSPWLTPLSTGNGAGDDPTYEDDFQLMREEINKLSGTDIRRFEKGFMLRGVDIEITLNADNFAGEGDVTLFGEMLHRFFALYADVHLFNQLTLVLQPTGKRLRWKENHSQHIPG